MKITLTKYQSAEEIDYFERDAHTIVADYTDVSELQRFHHPGIPTSGRVCPPNPSIEIVNAPPMSEEAIMGIISKESRILNSQFSPDILYF